MTRINPAAYRRRHTMYADALIERASTLVEQVVGGARTNYTREAALALMREREGITLDEVRAEARRIADLDAPVDQTATDAQHARHVKQMHAQEMAHLRRIEEIRAKSARNE